MNCVVKLQRDITGSRVLITDAATGAILRECTELDAGNIADAYRLAPMGRAFVHAEIDEQGLLHLGKEVNTP